MKTKLTVLTSALTLCGNGWAWADDGLVVPEVTVIAKHLDEARNALNPAIGASTYVMDADDIAALPLGANTDFTRVLYQMPGAAQNSMGQIHIRGDHADLQS